MNFHKFRTKGARAQRQRVFWVDIIYRYDIYVIYMEEAREPMRYVVPFDNNYYVSIIIWLSQIIIINHNKILMPSYVDAAVLM